MMIPDISLLADVARKAGAAILEIYHSADMGLSYKEDNSPLTMADKRSNQIICDALMQHYPSVPIIAEENKEIAYSERKDWQDFWLVDPLDGTKEFVKKRDEFTINIAYVEDKRPVFGLIYVPVTGVMYYAIKGQGAFKQIGEAAAMAIHKGPHYSTLSTVRCVASRSHNTTETAEFIKALEASGKQIELRSAGSALKFCLLAENEADVYPRFSPCMEWDTAAADIIIEEAGGQVLQVDNGRPLSYNKESLLSPFFIAE
jgi:3'(2'), 5'-bisphosphate nucleotidase